MTDITQRRSNVITLLILTHTTGKLRCRFLSGWYLWDRILAGKIYQFWD